MQFVRHADSYCEVAIINTDNRQVVSGRRESALSNLLRRLQSKRIPLHHETVPIRSARSLRLVCHTGKSKMLYIMLQRMFTTLSVVDVGHRELLRPALRKMDVSVNLKNLIKYMNIIAYSFHIIGNVHVHVDLAIVNYNSTETQDTL